MLTLPPQDRLRHLFDYDPQTGALTWRVATRRRPRGAVAGCIAPDKRVLVGIDGRLYKAHRVIWKWVTGEEPAQLIDHVDQDGTNNRWCNLRLASKSQNNVNRKRTKASGFKGVYPSGKGTRWYAAVKWRYVEHYLGTFATPEDAANARREFVATLHGAFACHD